MKMIKQAILILDMPECCAECPLDYDTMNCLGMNEYMETMGYDGKPAWCPLIPLSDELRKNITCIMTKTDTLM